MLIRPSLDDVIRYDERNRVLDRAFARSRGANRNRAMQRGASGGAVASPTQLAGMRVWLRGDLGIVLSGADVQKWEDQSSGGTFDFENAAASKPSYNATDANFGGKPSVTFDSAVPEFLTGPAASSWDWGHTGTGLSILIVLRRVGSGSFMVPFSTDSWAFTNTGLSVNADTSNNTIGLYVSKSGGAAVLDLQSSAGSFANTTAYYVEIYFATASTPDALIRINGVDRGSGNVASAPTTNPASFAAKLGGRANAATFPFNGQVAELVMYDQDHRTSGVLGSYARARYGL